MGPELLRSMSLVAGGILLDKRGISIDEAYIYI